MSLRWWPRAAVLLLVLAAAPALAQERGFRLHRETTTSAGSWLFLVERPWYSSRGFFAGTFGLDYGLAPLKLRLPSGPAPEGPIIAHTVGGQFDLALSLFDRLLLTASFPVSFHELGRTEAVSLVGPFVGFGTGDPRLGVRVRLFGQPEKSVLSAHVGADVWVPVGVAATHQGDTVARFLPRAVLAGAFGAVRWTVDAGFLFRQYASYGPPALGMTAASEARGGVALGLMLANERLYVGPEARLSMQVTGVNAFSPAGTSLEVLGGASYLIGGWLLVGLGAGAGFFGAPGTADFRGMLRLGLAPRRPPTLDVPVGPSTGGTTTTGGTTDGTPTDGTTTTGGATTAATTGGTTTSDGATPGTAPRGLTPRPGDVDGDGIADEVDRCPYEPELFNGVRDADGCPEFELEPGAPLAKVLAPPPRIAPRPAPITAVPIKPTPDAGVPVAPLVTGAPLEPPLLPPDADGDGVLDEDDRCPLTREDLDAFEDEDGCPELDNDGDGILDELDMCVDEAETVNGIADFDGCPDTNKDADDDKVPDAVDRCPYEPENRDGVRDDDGCPEYLAPAAPPLARLVLDPPAATEPPAPNTPALPTLPALPEPPPLGSTDADEDGLSDEVDRCPVTHEDGDSFEDEDGCPEPDNDADEVADSKDQCPEAAETVNGFEDQDGCPDEKPNLDVDGDGVDYEADRCPLEAGTPLDGCPHEPVAPLALPGFALPTAEGAALTVAPETPVAAATADHDKDGAPDDADPCPMTAEDLDGFEDEDGCPEPDNDHDGLADKKDKCPFEAETINGNKDDDGCPDKGESAVTIEEDAVVIKGIIRFKTASATLEPKSIPLVKQVAATLRAASTLSIEIQGHTDDVGNAAKNIALSKKRAETIRKFLVKAGVSERRLIATGYGPTRPRDTNKTAAGREQNRRVEFLILGEAR